MIIMMVLIGRIKIKAKRRRIAEFCFQSSGGRGWGVEQGKKLLLHIGPVLLKIPRVNIKKTDI